MSGKEETQEKGRSRIVLLDLEETLIDTWSTRNFLHYNAERIRQAGILTLAARVGFMSWAVCDAADSRIVIDELLIPIEETLGVKIDRMLPMSMQEYGADVLSFRNLRLSLEDMYDVFKKEEVLLALIRKNPAFIDHEIVLIDDAVDHNMSFNIPSRNAAVRFINVKEPVETWQC